MRTFAVIALLGPAVIVAAARAQTPDLYDPTTVRTLELTFHQQDWWQQLTQNYTAKIYIKADLKVDRFIYRDVGVRFRGNSSYKAIGSSQKKPFKISMDAFVPDQKLFGYRTVNLNNGFRDPTFTRELISCAFLRRIMPCPRCNYLNLVLNGQSWGPYINVQQINKDLLDEWFRDSDGNRYRAERQVGSPGNNSGLTWLGTSTTPYTRAYELKNSNPTQPWIDLIHLCNVLNNTPAATLPVELPKVLDVDEALRHLAGINLLPALDSYIGNAPHNYYLYRDGYHGRFSLLPWDLNASFGGNAWLTVQQKIRLDPFYRANQTYRPLLYRLIGTGRPWRARYLAHLRTTLNSWYDWKLLGAEVARQQALIGPELQKDAKKLYTMALFASNVTQDVQLRINNRWQIIPGLKPFVEGRRSFLLNHPELRKLAPILSELRRNPVRPTSVDTVWITVKTVGAVSSVTLLYRAQGPFVAAPMFDDGKHGDGQPGDGVFGAGVPPRPAFARVDYFVSATATQGQGGAMALLPAVGGGAPERYRVWTPPNASALQVSEFVARNENGVRDERGEREDWVELVNTGTTNVELGGLFLTDDVTEPTRWKFPAGPRLKPGEAVVVWADNEPSEGPLHATFKLAGAGEELALFDRDGKTPLDAVAFGPQVPDVSTGRLAGHPGVWATFPAPTPWTLNRPSPCGHLPYRGLSGGPEAIQLTGVGTARLGAAITYRVEKAPSSTWGLTVLAPAPLDVAIASFGSLLINPALLVPFAVRTDVNGRADLPIAIPNLGALAGTAFYFQSFVHDGKSGGLSNGVITLLCR